MNLRTAVLLLSVAVASFSAFGCGHPRESGLSPSRTPATELFRDVAKESGLNFKWGHGGKTPLNIIETLGHGCAFLDYDRDGFLDILLVGNRQCALYHNDGHGHFVDVTADSGLNVEGMLCGVAVGDYDNDGFPDVYITGYGKCALFHNTGKSKPVFEDVTARAGVEARGPYDNATAAAFVDLDGDGKLDLFVGRYIVFTPQSVQLCEKNGIKTGCGVASYKPDMPRVYRNLGSGRFREITKEFGFDSAHGRCLGVAIRMSDGGKGAAVYCANDEVACDLFVNRGGKFANIGMSSGTAYQSNGLTQAGMGADWGDFNRDGRLDLIVGTYQSEPNVLYRSDGRDFYTEVAARMGIAGRTAPFIAWTAKFVDYDNDGWVDLFFTNGHTQDNVHLFEPEHDFAQPLLLFHNEAGKVFTEVSSQAGTAFKSPIPARGAAFGDFDNDGKVDVLVVNEEGAPLLLHNQSPAINHWLGIRLIGSQSNRDGVGARVTVTTESGEFTQDHELAGGYISAHDPRLHFGLGSARQIKKITVRWPDGRVQDLVNAPIDAYVTIAEPGQSRNGTLQSANQ